MLTRIGIDRKNFAPTDWAQFQSSIVSNNPGLPALPLIMEIIKRRAAFFLVLLRALKNYSLSGRGAYSSEVANSTLIHFPVRLDEFRKASNALQTKVNKYDNETAGKSDSDIINRRAAFMNEIFDELELASYQRMSKASDILESNFKDFVKTSFVDRDKRTLLFNTILSEMRNEIEANYRASLTKAEKKPFKFVQIYNKILNEYLVRTITKSGVEIDRVEQDLKKTTDTIDKLIHNQGNITLVDVEYPYKQRPDWVMQPRNSGVLLLNPRVTSAITVTHDQLRDLDSSVPNGFVKWSQTDFEDLQDIPEIAPLLARAVAINMAQPSVIFPKQYRFKGTEKMLDERLSVVFNKLRKFRLIKKNRGKNGRIRYEVKYEERKDPLS
jgi:hypothetical protein